MAPPRRWLILSHSYNADGRAASLTVTDKIPVLERNGIEVTVLSAATGEPDALRTHYQLMPWGPAGIRFDFRHIMARRYGRGLIYRVSTLLVSILLAPFILLERVFFGVSNQASWYLPAARKGIQLARQGDFELVYSSGGAASAHHAAAIIKQRCNLPWIAEIHDPMVIRDDPSDDGTAPRKSRNARYLARLERRICNEADHVWWFTQAALDYARHRNPSLQDKGFVMAPGSQPPPVSSTHQYSETLNICHFGAITNDRSLAPLLRAIDQLAAADPAILEKVRIHVYGSGPDDIARQVIAERQLQSIVVDRGRVAREDAIRRMFEADCLLLLHGDYEWCAEYIPSKLYDYLWTRRPILAITNRNPFLDQFLEGYGAYIAHTLAPETIENAVRQLYQDWHERNLQSHTGSPISVESATEAILHRISP